MSQRTLVQFGLILVVVAMSIYIVIPNSPGIHLGSAINKDFETRLGLDLVGGAQILLEADLPQDATIDPEAMRTAASIVENRVNGLGVNEAMVQQAGSRRVLVELPGETDPEKAKAYLQQTGLLEFVDFSDLTSEEAMQLINNQTPIITDYGGGTNPEASASITDTLASRTYHTMMTGDKLKTVYVDTSQTGQPVISFELTTEGAQVFSEYTSAHIGDMLAIVLDKKVISAPGINNAITDGRGIIQGGFTVESANALSVQLRYGSLPIPLKVVEDRLVGPTLGQDSLRKSMLAYAIGFAVVILFMGLYYRLPGAIADLSIIIYALVAFAIFRFIPITLTLPGIAGFMLSTGSALDANILIFERLKEELRSGKTLRQAVDLGFRRAWSSIRDANVATIITSVILFWFGSSFGATIVKGFSITLLIGVLISLFTALVVTRVFMQLALANFKSTDYEKWFGI